jgi:predicted nucleic acid-binding protein
VILLDTSIWMSHLRESNPLVGNLLAGGQVLAHPFVIGELALGGLRQRDLFIARLHQLPSTLIASNDEVLVLILENDLHSSGIGYVDAHLLASVRMTPGAGIWTRDQKMAAVAERLAIAARPHDA